MATISKIYHFAMIWYNESISQVDWMGFSKRSLNLLDSWLSQQQNNLMTVRWPVWRFFCELEPIVLEMQPGLCASCEKKDISTDHRTTYAIYNENQRQNKEHTFSDPTFMRPIRRFWIYYHNYFPFDYYRRKGSTDQDTKFFGDRNEHNTSATKLNTDSLAIPKFSPPNARNQRNQNEIEIQKKWWQLRWSCKNVLIVQTKLPSSVPCAAETHMNTIGITNDFMEPNVI